ncbi:MAG: hypothetical protein Q8L22_02300 [Reyranella sp.]|nr:hypothetical protein [Reyranella sp.]
MCELTAALMMGVSGAQTILGAQQQAQQAAAQQSLRAYQASYQTAVARNAAQVSEYNAQDAERRGAVEEGRQRRKTSLLLGTQQARLAAQGSDLEGSPLDILGDTAALGEEEALATRYQAAREAWAQRIQAANQNAQADFLMRSVAMPTGADPGLRIARSLLGGESDLFGIAEKRNLLPKR